MWLLTPIGFFSAVRKPGDSTLTVRARVAGDLDSLRARYLPRLSPVDAHGGTDYPFRARCTQEEWAMALARMALDIDYGNFKSEVAKRQGPARAHVYSKVWSALRSLESSESAAPAPAPATPPAPPASGTPKVAAGAAPAKPRPAPATAGKWFSCGGIVVREDGKVLIRKVANGHDGEGWTWSKGRVDDGEAHEAAALREVREETGVIAEIVCSLPGDHEGTASVTRYWLMCVVEETGNFDRDETEAIAWVTPDEARHRIRTTTRSALKITRDLEVLDAALAATAARA